MAAPTAAPSSSSSSSSAQPLFSAMEIKPVSISSPSSGVGEPAVLVVGTPFSTFTRTICMGLCHNRIEYKQLAVMPHSTQADDHHPFGRIPSFCHNGRWLFESAAIARYIDSALISSHPSMIALTPSDPYDAAVVWQWVSSISDYAFAILEHQLVKVRTSAQAENQADDKIAELLKPGLAKSRDLFATLESHLCEQHADYLLGTSLSWADLFLAPILADVTCLPEGGQLLNESTTPKLTRWWASFVQNPSFVATTKGTLAHPD